MTQVNERMSGNECAAVNAVESLALQAWSDACSPWLKQIYFWDSSDLASRRRYRRLHCRSVALCAISLCSCHPVKCVSLLGSFVAFKQKRIWERLRQTSLESLRFKRHVLDDAITQYFVVSVPAAPARWAALLGSETDIAIEHAIAHRIITACCCCCCCCCWRCSLRDAGLAIAHKERQQTHALLAR